MRQFRVVTLVSVGLAASNAVPSGFGADVSLYLVKKGLEYTQTDSNTPSLNATNSNAFEADVVMSGANTVTNAAVQPPGGVPLQPLALSTGNTWNYKHKYNSLAKLDQHYPDGSYVFQIAARNDGPRQPTLSLLGSVYPNAPYIQNFSGTQTVNANGYLLVTWNGFMGGSASDFVQFRVEDLAGNKIFETPDLGKPGFWDGTAGRVVLAPGSTAYAQTNRATLTFQKNVALDTTSYPGALGASAYFSRTTFFLLTTTAAAPDVKVCEVSKARKWVQSNSNSIVAEPGQEFVFDASVQAYTTGVLSTASLTLPPTTNPPSRNLALQSNGTKLDFSDVAGTEAGLQALYANGSYKLSFATPHDGSRSLNLILPVDDFPPAPRVSNFDALQIVDASQPITVSWDPWAGGSINDFVQVRVEDHNGNKFFETPDLGKAGAIDGRATTTDIPAGTLPLGQGFEIHVTFTRLSGVDTTSYPGVLALTDFQARTKFNLQTAPAPGSKPVLTITALSAGQGYELSALVAANLTCRIDGSTNLQQWIPLVTNKPPGNLLQWQDVTQRGTFFYRAVVLP